MKKIIFLLSFLVLSKISFCDVVPDNSHAVNKCVKIINIADFPDFTLLGRMIYPTGLNVGTYIINSNICLDKGYKFDHLYIFAVKKNYLANKDIDSTDWLKDNNALKSNIPIECYGGYESNANPVSDIEEFYKIAGFTDTSMILYKCKEIIRFGDGRPISIKTYSLLAGKEKLDKEYTEENHSKFDSPKIDYSATEIYPNTEVAKFLQALLITILIETLVLFLLFKTKYKKLNINNKLLLFTSILASFSTLPFVWFVLPIYVQPNLSYLLVSESSVMIVESLIIYMILKIDYKKALIVSIACNLVSFFGGLILNWMHVL